MHAAKYAGLSLPEWHRLPLLFQSHYLSSMAAESAASKELQRFIAERKKQQDQGDYEH